MGTRTRTQAAVAGDLEVVGQGAAPDATVAPAGDAPPRPRGASPAGRRAPRRATTGDAPGVGAPSAGVDRSQTAVDTLVDVTDADMAAALAIARLRKIDPGLANRQMLTLLEFVKDREAVENSGTVRPRKPRTARFVAVQEDTLCFLGVSSALRAHASEVLQGRAAAVALDGGDRVPDGGSAVGDAVAADDDLSEDAESLPPEWSLVGNRAWGAMVLNRYTSEGRWYKSQLVAAADVKRALTKADAPVATPEGGVLGGYTGAGDPYWVYFFPRRLARIWLQGAGVSKDLWTVLPDHLTTIVYKKLARHEVFIQACGGRPRGDSADPRQIPAADRDIKLYHMQLTNIFSHTGVCHGELTANDYAGRTAVEIDRLILEGSRYTTAMDTVRGKSKTHPENVIVRMHEIDALIRARLRERADAGMTETDGADAPTDLELPGLVEDLVEVGTYGDLVNGRMFGARRP